MDRSLLEKWPQKNSFMQQSSGIHAIRQAVNQIALDKGLKLGILFSKGQDLFRRQMSALTSDPGSKAHIRSDRAPVIFFQ